MAAIQKENKTRNYAERLVYVETTLDNVLQTTNEIKTMIQKQDKRFEKLITTTEADLRYASKEIERDFKNLKTNSGIMFWGALSGLVGIVAFFIKYLFFSK